MAKITHGEEWLEASLRSRYLTEYARAHKKEVITVERREELLRKHGPFLSTLGRTVANLLDYVWEGIYHLDTQQLFRAKWTDEHHIILLVGEGLQTWDFNRLTKLVVAAHDLAVRVEVNPCTFRYLQLYFSQRSRAEGVNRNSEYHPTIERAVRMVRARAQFTDLEFCIGSFYDDRCGDLAVFEHLCGAHWMELFGHLGHPIKPSHCVFCSKKSDESFEGEEFVGYFRVGDRCPEKPKWWTARTPVTTPEEAASLWPLSKEVNR